MNRSLVAAYAIALALGATASLAAQDTTFRGITLDAHYDPLHDKVGVVVLPIPGAFGDSIRAIVQRDLDFSDRFTVIPIDSSDPGVLRNGPAAGLNYALFARLAAKVVVDITPVGNGLHVALHDVDQSRVANVKEFPLSAVPLNRQWRLDIHRADDVLESWVTGQPGISATRIAYIRAGKIRVIDSDGADEIDVPTDENGASPAWSPNGSQIVYTTFGASHTGEVSHIVTFDLTNAQRRVLVPPARNQQLVAPVFSPDGNSVIYSREGDHGSDIWSVPVAGGAPRQLTTSPRQTVNTSVTVAPNGHRMVFVSNRSGPPELYIMDADGTNVSKLTDYDFSERAYRSDPDWSPDGQLIAYQERINERFQIRTIPVSGGTPKQWTNEGENEQPSWAPDSRHLVFMSTRTGTPQLWVVDLSSSRLRQLTKSPGSKLPAWSPRLGVAQ